MGTFPLPPRTIRLAGRWAAATGYHPGNLVRIEPSATVPRGLSALAPADFTSDTADPAKDLAAQKLVAVAYDGKPAQTYRGTYVDGATYVYGETVFYGPTATFYQMMLTVTPAGSKPDRPLVGADGSFTVPWAPISVPTYRAIRVRADGMPAANALVFREMMDRYATFGGNFVPANAPGTGPSSVLRATTAPKALAYFTVKLNGATIELLAFGANSTMAGFTTPNGASIQIAVGDILEIFAPATQDAALADVLGFLNLTVY